MLCLKQFNFVHESRKIHSFIWNVSHRRFLGNAYEIFSLASHGFRVNDSLRVVLKSTSLMNRVSILFVAVVSELVTGRKKKLNAVVCLNGFSQFALGTHKPTYVLFGTGRQNIGIFSLGYMANSLGGKY